MCKLCQICIQSTSSNRRFIPSWIIERIAHDVFLHRRVGELRGLRAISYIAGRYMSESHGFSSLTNHSFEKSRFAAADRVNNHRQFVTPNLKVEISQDWLFPLILSTAGHTGKHAKLPFVRVLVLGFGKFDRYFIALFIGYAAIMMSKSSGIII